MTTSEENTKKSKFSKNKTNEEVLMGFQKLRNEQRFLVNKLSEFELDLQEHRIVIKTLKDLDGDRKCFRMIGGILCERTVKDILPLLRANEENLVKVIDTYGKRLQVKEEELIKYKEDYNVKFKNLEDIIQTTVSTSKSTEDGVSTNTSGPGGGILIT